jgi:RNA polymerase sigma-70 factor (ECF subfamily)
MFDRPVESRQEPPRDGSIDQDERIDVERAFRSLGPSDREALLLVDVLGFTPKEASSISGSTREAFRVRLHRARTRLTEAYGRE